MVPDRGALRRAGTAFGRAVSRLGIGGAMAFGALSTIPFVVVEEIFGPDLPGHPFILLVPAVIAASALFGLPGGTAALVSATLYANFYQLPPKGTFLVDDPRHAVALLVFIAVGGYTLAVMNALHGALRRRDVLVKDLAAAVKAQEAAERDKDVLLGELNHRVKNAIASVASVGRQTLRTSSDLAGFSESFERRIGALTRAQELVVKEGGGDLEDILAGEMAPYVDDPASVLSGPRVALGPKATLSLGLLFHELATNAGKYGGLSKAGGGIRVSWDDDGSTLSVDWREVAEIAPEAVSRKGFGTRLLELTAGSLRGSVDTDAAPSGYGFRLRMPVAALSA